MSGTSSACARSSWVRSTTNGKCSRTSLWVVEGITDYYGDVLVHRAGLSSPQEFLDSLSDKIEELQTTPGRAVRSVSLASLDAWIKLYRPDENSPNTTISYYTKGAVVAFLLDAAIRRATNGTRTSGRGDARGVSRSTPVTRGFTPAEFRALTERVAGTDLGAFWRSAIEGTDELDYTRRTESLRSAFQADHGIAHRSTQGLARCDDPR